MYKLILLDIDGTLRDEVLGVPPTAIKAIEECRKKGVVVVLCTGRSMGTIPDEILAIPVDGYIAGGGSYIKYQQKIIQNETFDSPKIYALLKALKANTAITVESQSKVFMNQSALEILNSMNEMKRKNPLSLQEKIVYTNNLQLYQGEAIHKICLWSTTNVFNEVSSLLENQIHLAQMIHDLNVNYYEIVKVGCDKGTASKTLQRLLNISKEECLCFGDGLNDLDMFYYSGTKIAMKNSPQELCEQATSICEAPYQDGIYNELKRRKII